MPVGLQSRDLFGPWPIARTRGSRQRHCYPALEKMLVQIVFFLSCNTMQDCAVPNPFSEHPSHQAVRKPNFLAPVSQLLSRRRLRKAVATGRRLREDRTHCRGKELRIFLEEN